MIIEKRNTLKIFYSKVNIKEKYENPFMLKNNKVP